MLRSDGRLGRVLGNMILNVAALGGAIFIVLIILSAVFNISLIMFKTGSMSPTIPAGSLAVVKEISASDIKVGDVLTVDRGTKLPVTHRVTSVEGTGETRTITMKGDANDSEDPLPYAVTEVRRVLVSVPGLAHVVVWLSNPLVLGALTIATSLLVTWAFWPKSERGQRKSLGSKPDGSPEISDVDSVADRAASRPSAVVGMLAVVLGVGVGLVPPMASAAEAVQSTPTQFGPKEAVARGEHLTLTSIGDPTEMLSMQPGVPVYWQVGVTVDSVEPGEIDIAVSAQGSSGLGLVLEFQTCSERWVDTRCSGESRSIDAPQPVDVGGDYRPLFKMHSDDLEEWLLVSATIPEPGNGRVDLNVRASGEGEIVTAGPGQVGALAVTGAEPSWVALLGVGAVVAGLAAAGLATAGKKTKWRRGAS